MQQGPPGLPGGQTGGGDFGVTAIVTLVIAVIMAVPAGADRFGENVKWGEKVRTRSENERSKNGME